MPQDQNQTVPAAPPGFTPVTTPTAPQTAAAAPPPPPPGFVPVAQDHDPNQPGFVQSFVENSPFALIEPPQSPTETMIHASAGPGAGDAALAAWRAAKSVVESGQKMVESTKADYAATKAAFQQAVQDFHQSKYGRAMEDVGSGIAVPFAAPAAGSALAQTEQDIRNPKTRAAALGRVAGQVTTAATGTLGGEELAADEGSNLIKNPFRTEISGESFTTNPMTSTANVEAGTAATKQIAGETAGAPLPENTSLRDVWKPAIDAREAAAKSFYKQLDDISDNRWGAIDQELKNVRAAIRDQGGTRGDEWDQAMNAKKIRLEMQEQEILDKLPPNTVAQAKRLWTEKSRLEDLNDIFNKKSNVTGIRPEMMKPGVKGLPAEQYNWKGIAKDINSIPPGDLVQMVGKTNAQNLTAVANLAAKQGWVNGVMLGVFKRALMFTGAERLVHLVP